MNYSSRTILSRNLFQRFSHRRRYTFCSNLINAKKPKNFLDYGAGDGELVKFLNFSKKKIFLFEPKLKIRNYLYKNIQFQKNIKIYKKKNQIKKNYFDLISILEVFEHLTLSNSSRIINHLRLIGKPNVIILISLPIETGFSGLFKNLVRFSLGQAHSDANFKNISKSLFGITIERPDISYNPSHIGFNHSKFIKFLKKNKLRVIETYYSPFEFFGSFFNSQIFLVCKFFK